MIYSRPLASQNERLPMCRIKLLIVDDHPLFRQGLVDVLETDPEMQVVAEAAEGEVAIAFARQYQPNVILMDVSLPNTNGLQVTRQIMADSPDAKIVVLTGYDEPEQIIHAFVAGARAFCTKDIPPEELLNTVRTVHAGKYVVNGRTMTQDEVLVWADSQMGNRGGGPPGTATATSAPLSPREMEILEEVTRGASNKEIALRLGISQQTVKNHMTAILRKLNVNDRTQAAIFALRHGWVRLDSPE